MKKMMEIAPEIKGQKDKKHFFLNSSCFLVKGALRSAIYDLKTGNVYSINKTSANILEKLERGISFSDVCRENENINRGKIISYLKQLKEIGIGKFINDNHYPEKIKIEKPIEELNFIHLELTCRCNLQCLHCYNEALSANRLSNDREINFNKWVEVLREAYELGCRRVQFIGGEPFLKRKMMFGLISQARKTGYQFIEVFSNCFLVTDKDLRRLKEYNVRLAASAYSQDEKIHDQITQKISSWRQTINNIKKAKEIGIPVRVAIVIMRQNEFSIEETVKFLKIQLGIKNIGIDFVRPAGRGCNSNLVSETILENQRLQGPKFSKIKLEVFCKRKFNHSCFSREICISSTGEIHPCIMERNIVYGNVRNQSLAEILSSNLAKHFRGLSKDNIKVCQDCEYRYLCFDCRVKARTISDFYVKPHWCLYDPYKGQWQS